MIKRAEQLMEIVHDMHRLMPVLSKRFDAFSELTMVQMGVLQLLCDRDSLSMSDISKELKITPASASALVDRLVQKNWLQRTQDKEDRRRMVISMSDSALENMKGVMSAKIELNCMLLSFLEEEEQVKLLDLMEKVRLGMKKV